MADLKLTVDTSDLQAAVNWLEKMGLEGTKISTKTRNLNKEFEAYNRHLKQSNDQYRRLKATTDPAWAAQQKLAQAVKTVREQVRQKNISVKEGMTTLRAYKAQLDAAVVSGRGFGRSMNRSGVMVQQAGYQVGDFIVQVQSGTNAFVAFGQQATQVAGTLTLLGGKWLMIGSALGIAIPLLTAVGAAIMRTREEADDTSDEIKRLADQFENALSKSKDLADSIRELKLGVSPEELAILDKITESQEALVAAQEAAEKSRESLRRPDKAALKAVELAEQELAANKEALKVLRERMKEEGALSAHKARLKALRDEREELKRNFALIQSEYTALDLSLRRSEGVDTQLNRVLSARVVSYAEMIDQQREQTGISHKQGSQMVALYEETERVRLQTEMLLKPAIKFAEAVESSRYDAKALADMDIDRSLIDAAIQSGILSKNMADALLAAVALVDKAPELAQIGARMAANYQGRENLLPIEEGPGSTFGTFLTLGSMGELPTGKKKKTEQPDRIGALARSLATEAEMLESWRSEGLLQIQDFNAKELELLGGHQAAVERLEQEHQNRLNTIEQNARQKKLSDTAGMFGALASIAETGGKKTAKAAATAQAIEGTVNAYGAAIKALNTPNISLAGRFTAYASVLAAGLKGVQSIKQAGGVSAGGSGGSGSIATPSAVTEAAPQRVLVEGIGPNDLISGAQLSEIFDRLYEENENRGLVFQIAT